MNTFISTQVKQEKEKLSKKLIKLQESIINSKIPENIVRGGIINCILNYNNSKLFFKVKKPRELVNKFIKSFALNDIIRTSLTNIDNKFIEPSPFRTMISFNKNISQEKQYLKFYFKILMINQNITEIIWGINNLINIKNKNIENLLKKLNFKNPYAIILIRDLLNELIIAENESDN
jgi:hypothetical protein